MANKDWKGNSKSTFACLGASNHTDFDRQNYDYYATDPIAMKLLLDNETFNNKIWECACGEKHLTSILEKKGYSVRSSDLINRCNNEIFDFLSIENQEWNGDIITNPPYAYAKEFIEKSLQIIPEGNKVAMFLKLTFLEGKARKSLFVHFPPKILYVSSSRIQCAMNGDFEKYSSSAIAYGWYVWEKGFNGNTIIKWIN